MSLFSKKKQDETAVERVARKRLFRWRLGLCALSGTMLGFSFPPSHFGILACFGLVPLLIVVAEIDRYKPALWYGYGAFLVFHIITVNWTGGYAHMNDPYMMIAGAVEMTVHPFFYFLPLFGYLFIKKNLGERIALIALPFVWVAYEYSHTLSEWSFPWLSLGNSQSYNIAGIQFISATGVLGLSFWILIVNVLAYILYTSVAANPQKPLATRNLLLAGLIVLVYVAPRIYGNVVLSSLPSAGTPISDEGRFVTVGMIQSNVDPWEKWKMTGMQTIDLYLGMTRDLVQEDRENKPDIVLWPETAVPYYLLTETHKQTLQYLRDQLDLIDVPVLTGLPHAVFYADSSQAPPSAKRLASGQRYDAFNAAAFIQPGDPYIPWYGKMKMVPIAERVPYADAFYFLGFLQWGVGIGGWQLGKDSVIFREDKTGTQFCTMICYESTYPAFVASFVKKGAEFIAIITIDSWWDNMSGAYQHNQFAIFRAIENRRWIARCAVGGISDYIDPYGRMVDKTGLFTKTTLNRTIGRNRELTFYTEHGEWLSEACVFIAGMFLAAAIGQTFKNKKHSTIWKAGA